MAYWTALLTQVRRGRTLDFAKVLGFRLPKEKRMFVRTRVAKARGTNQTFEQDHVRWLSNFAAAWSKYNMHLDELPMKLSVESGLAHASAMQEEQARIDGRDFEAVDLASERIFFTAVAESMNAPVASTSPIWR